MLLHHLILILFSLPLLIFLGYLVPDFLESILRPLSDSQQALEADLELKDEEIRNQIAKEDEERKAKQEQDELKKKHKKTPRLIKRRPPGLSVFQLESHSIFSFTDLSLEEDFGWAGRKRLVESGLAPTFG